jgi:hypothetical protein
VRFLFPLFSHLFSSCTHRGLKLPLVLSLELVASLLNLYFHPPLDNLHVSLVLPHDALNDPFLYLATHALLQLPWELITQLSLDALGELITKALVQVGLSLVPQVLQTVRSDKVSFLRHFFLVGRF